MVAAVGAIVIATWFTDTDKSEDSPPDPHMEAPLAAPIFSSSANPSSLSVDFHEPSLTLARDCISECVGVDVGYRWAAAREIERAEGCAGYSESFNDGCRAYARERGESHGVTTGFYSVAAAQPLPPSHRRVRTPP